MTLYDRHDPRGVYAEARLHLCGLQGTVLGLRDHADGCGDDAMGDAAQRVLDEIQRRLIDFEAFIEGGLDKPCSLSEHARVTQGDADG